MGSVKCPRVTSYRYNRDNSSRSLTLWQNHILFGDRKTETNRRLDGQNRCVKALSLSRERRLNANHFFSRWKLYYMLLGRTTRCAMSNGSFDRKVSCDTHNKMHRITLMSLFEHCQPWSCIAYKWLKIEAYNYFHRKMLPFERRVGCCT